MDYFLWLKRELGKVGPSGEDRLLEKKDGDIPVGTVADNLLLRKLLSLYDKLTDEIKVMEELLDKLEEEADDGEGEKCVCNQCAECQTRNAIYFADKRAEMVLNNFWDEVKVAFPEFLGLFRNAVRCYVAQGWEIVLQMEFSEEEEEVLVRASLN